MTKLRLELDELAVESFATMRDEEDGEGTIRGHENPSIPPWCATGGYCKTQLTYCPCTPLAEE